MTWKPEIKLALDRLLQVNEEKKIAVFDADGTLWYDDLGEAFFKYQIKQKLAPGIKNIADPWAEYKSRCAKNMAAAYGWLAQINAGLPDEELHDQAQRFYDQEFKSKLDPHLKDLIRQLTQHQFQIWICTASIKWALTPAVKDLGIPVENLIAVEVELDSKNRLTSKLIEPIPYRPGKKYWLEQKLSSKPLLVAGNSMGDLEMMGLAQNIALAIIFKPHLPEIKESEEGLILEATKRAWPIQIFQQ